MWKHLSKVKAYEKAYVKSAITTAAGKAQSIMEDDKSIEKVIVKYPYSLEKDGSVEVIADRSKEFHFKDKETQEDRTVTKSKLRINVEDPSLKVAKGYIKGLEASMTAALIG